MIYSEYLLLCIGVPVLLSSFFVRREARWYSVLFLIGMVTCLISGYISGYLHLVTGGTPEETAVYIAPMVEEILKLLPLLFMLLVLRVPPLSLMQCAAALGTGFATFENCCFLLQNGTQSLAYTLIRGLAVGVMHIVSLLLLTMGLSTARRYNALSTSSVIGALSLSVTFHALYNLLVSAPGVTSFIGYSLPLLTALLLYIPFRGMTSGDT